MHILKFRVQHTNFPSLWTNNDLCFQLHLCNDGFRALQMPLPHIHITKNIKFLSTSTILWTNKLFRMFSNKLAPTDICEKREINFEIWMFVLRLINYVQFHHICYVLKSRHELGQVIKVIRFALCVDVGVRFWYCLLFGRKEIHLEREHCTCEQWMWISRQI